MEKIVDFIYHLNREVKPETNEFYGHLKGQYFDAKNKQLLNSPLAQISYL